MKRLGVDGTNVAIYADGRHEGRPVCVRQFTNVGGVAVQNVARWNGSAWHEPGGSVTASPALPCCCTAWERAGWTAIHLVECLFGRHAGRLRFGRLGRNQLQVVSRGRKWTFISGVFRREPCVRRWPSTAMIVCQRNLYGLPALSKATGVAHWMDQLLGAGQRHEGTE